MKSAALPIKIHCPFSHIEETVYFYPVEINGEWYIDINRFNGCDNSWHSCQECEVCKIEAYAKVIKQDK